LIKDGGRIALYNNIRPVLRTLIEMIEGAHNPTNLGMLPDGYRTPRVRRSLDDLHDSLRYLRVLVEQVEMKVPPTSQQ
jgi:hypothetical protein